MNRIFLILFFWLASAYAEVQNCHEMFVFPGEDLNTILQKKRDSENNCICFDTTASGIKFGDETAVPVKKWLVTGVANSSQNCDSICTANPCNSSSN